MASRNNFDSLESNRYRALLDVSTAIASQTDLHAVLHSISALLSKVVPFNSISLLLLDSTEETAQLYALEASAPSPGFEIGTKLPFKNTAVATALETQQPVFAPDAQAEAEKIPNLPVHVRFETTQSAYIFPVSSSGRKLGVLIFGAQGRTKFTDANVELMGSVTAHVAVALENALALESAENYRKQLEHERDRLKLLLEINNHIVNHLDVNDLAHAASASIRDFFKNDFTGIWLFEEGSDRLQCLMLDFPDSHGGLESMPTPQPTKADLEAMRTRTPKLIGKQEIDAFPEFLLRPLRAESIVAIAGAPLLGAHNFLGVLSLGSRRADAFSQPDLDLLMQISNQISLALENALAFGRLNISHARLEDERHYLEAEIQSEYNFEDIVGKSAALRKALDQVAIVAPTDSTVLLVGETGTGKELIARAIHNLSARQHHTFVRLNCAAIPQGLLESELFGHEKGAFTGALMQKRGRVELAHEGTLFLDEIGDIDLELQPKLLRILQEREFERLGSNRTIKADVRMIAATNRDLAAMVQNGEFREDLYYRLNVFPIHVPPLRERREDIPYLVHYFVGLQARKMRKIIRVIPREVMDVMMRWNWPGNVRELQNFVERSVILTRTETLAAPISELKRSAPQVAGSATLHATEREAIVQALHAAQGKISGAGGAAERLGLKRTTLQSKMERLGISRSEYA